MYNDWNSCSHCYLRQPGKNHHQYEYTILNEYTYAGELKNELDARQMRGTSALTLELIRKEFTDPLSNQLTELSAAIGNLQGRVSGMYCRQGKGRVRVLVDSPFNWGMNCTFSGTVTMNLAQDSYHNTFCLILPYHHC